MGRVRSRRSACRGRIQPGRLGVYKGVMRRLLPRLMAPAPAGMHARPDRANRLPPRRGLAALGVVAVLAGATTFACAPAPIARVEPGAGLPAHDLRLAEPGPLPVQIDSGELRSAYGCEVRFELHRPSPEGDRGAMTVMLAHGFMRDLRSVRGWAEHLASHGVATVVVSFCNSTPFQGRHARNAEDLRAVAAAIAPGDAPVVYAGFSAGGLAAYLAAAADPRAVAYLGLDAVDSAGLAASVASLALPASFFAAEPSRCNAEGNMLPLALALPAGRVVLIAHATHCDFENPTSALCERLCGRVEPPEAAEAIRRAIRALATDWALRHAHGR